MPTNIEKMSNTFLDCMCFDYIRLVNSNVSMNKMSVYNRDYRLNSIDKYIRFDLIAEKLLKLLR